jgi:hypothetical protein
MAHEGEIRPVIGDVVEGDDEGENRQRKHHDDFGEAQCHEQRSTAQPIGE